MNVQKGGTIMKKIIMAVITALLVAVAVPVLAASSEDNTCPVRSCWQNNASCNNGEYCRNDRSYCRDDSYGCAPDRNYRGCGGSRYCR